MSSLLDFPQRQHEEFSQLVHDAVTSAAQTSNLSVEDYIHKIYYQDANPTAFSQPFLLEELYQQYQNLIENAVKSVDDASIMSNTNKTYLCYRIYLHGMTIERKIMSAAASEKSLVKSLREFFYARGKVLSLKDEVNLINSLTFATHCWRLTP